MTTGPSTEPWTVIRLLQWTTDFFKRKRFDSPRLDAEVLLATAMGCRRIELYTSYDKQPEDEVREAFRELVRRRGEGMPVAYLVGHKEFYSLEFIVNENVLIPRPETEHVVIEALDLAKKTPDRVLKIVDVGTGSGAIAVAIAKHLPKATFVAIDCSNDALEIARRNIEKHQLSDRIKTVQSDLFASIPAAEKFDLIVSNPPYVSAAEYEQLSPEVKNHEPKGALLGGKNGTEIIERLLDASLDRLTPGGSLILELSPMIHAAVQELITARPGFEAPKTIRDLAAHARVLSVKRR